jgi:hypothetical protein
MEAESLYPALPIPLESVCLRAYFERLSGESHRLSFGSD